MCSIDSLFGGPSKAEKNLGAQSVGLASAMAGDFSTVFGEQQQTLGQLKDELQRINTGSEGMGYSAEENQLLQSQITEQAGAAERNAIQANANRVAGRNQSGPVATGAEQAIAAGITAAGETSKAHALTAETLSNIAQGRQNAITTASGLGTLAGLENPEGYGRMAGSENQVAFGQADTLNKEHNAAIGSMIKTGIGAATMGMTGIAGGLGALGPGESFGEGVGDFTKGALGALAGQ